MADEADLAQEYTELERTNALLAVKKIVTGKGRKKCIDCGEPIPAMRRKIIPWSLRCVECQEIFERQNK